MTITRDPCDGESLGDAAQATCGVAFKEWAAVCQALGAGEQILILRKGGIHEGRDGFRVSHREFWLYPTRFHESADQLAPAGTRFVESARIHVPPMGKIRLSQYAVVTDVIPLRDEALLARIEEKHIWSRSTATARFHYRAPGLFVLLARIYQRLPPHEIAETAAMAGCRSWVELESPLETNGLSPVMSTSDFLLRRHELLSLLEPR